MIQVEVFWIVTSCGVVVGRSAIQRSLLLKMVAAWTSEALTSCRGAVGRYSPEDLDFKNHHRRKPQNSTITKVLQHLNQINQKCLLYFIFCFIGKGAERIYIVYYQPPIRIPWG
jgi:hypothetical protein